MPIGTHVLRHLLAHGLEVERMSTGDELGDPGWVVVEEPCANHSESDVERREVLANRLAARSMRKLIGIEVQPPDMIGGGCSRYLIDEIVHDVEATLFVVVISREISAEESTSRNAGGNRVVGAVVVDEVDTLATLCFTLATVLPITSASIQVPTTANSWNSSRHCGASGFGSDRTHRGCFCCGFK